MLIEKEIEDNQRTRALGEYGEWIIQEVKRGVIAKHNREQSSSSNKCWKVVQQSNKVVPRTIIAGPSAATMLSVLLFSI